MSLLDIIPGERWPAHTRSITFGEAVIKIARLRYGDLSFAEIAKLVWVTPATLRRWSDGGLPPVNGLRWTAHCLGLVDTAFLHFRPKKPFHAARPVALKRAA